MIKGKGQRLIPEELLKYLEALKKEYPEAVNLVEANPTLEGGEDSLESVLINGVKYAVGGGGSTLDDIVDSAGNKRFVEGNLTCEVTAQEITDYGFTPIYNKWSLSGTHLMIVASFSLTTGWTPNKTIFSATLPNYIYNKVFPLVEGGFVSRVKFPDSLNTDRVFELRKGNNNKLEVYSSSTFLADRAVRVQFDLLIDAE